MVPIGIITTNLKTAFSAHTGNGNYMQYILLISLNILYSIVVLEFKLALSAVY